MQPHTSCEHSVCLDHPRYCNWGELWALASWMMKWFSLLPHHCNVTTVRNHNASVLPNGLRRRLWKGHSMPLGLWFAGWEPLTWWMFFLIGRVPLEEKGRPSSLFLFLSWPKGDQLCSVRPPEDDSSVQSQKQSNKPWLKWTQMNPFSSLGDCFRFYYTNRKLTNRSSPFKRYFFFLFLWTSHVTTQENIFHSLNS